MTPEEDNISGAFSEFLLVPLEGVPTYEYMANLNLYLNLCSSAFDCTFGCGTLGYLVVTANPDIFNTHCGTALVTPRNTGIRPVMLDPTPKTAVFQNSSEPTSTKLVYLTSTMLLIVRARKS